MQEQGQPDRSARNKNILVAVTIFTLVTFNILQLYIREMNEQEQQDKYESKQRELVVTFQKLDSISRVLDDRIKTIRRLGGRVDSLISVRKRVEQEKYALRQAKDLADTRYQEIRGRVNEYQALIEEKGQEIIELKAEYTSLNGEIDSLMEETGNLMNRVSELEGENGELSSQMMEIASAVTIGGITLFSQHKDGKKEEGREFESKKIDKLLVDVVLNPNIYAAETEKDLYISIIDPNKQEFSNSDGLTFKFEGQDIFYTQKKSFIFRPDEGNKIGVSYQRSSAFIPGKYTVKVYCDGKFLGKENFTVN